MKLFSHFLRCFSLPVFENIEINRQAKSLWRILRAITCLTLLGACVALQESQNSTEVTLVFYGLVLGCYAIMAGMIRRGKVVLAAWSCSLFIWILIAFVTLAFGGLQGQNASTFAVCVLLIGSVVGGRAAIGMAIASSAWGALIWVLEERGSLPWALGPYAPSNAWISMSITVLLTSVLFHESLTSLRQMHAKAEKSSAERDEALRQNIQRQKMELVGTLTSGIAHDLNNLLTVIVMTIDLMREPTNLAIGKLLTDLEDAATRSAQVTRQLLALGRKNTGSGEVINWEAFLQAHSRMAALSVGTTIEVVIRPGPEAWVNASQSGLEQILLNLVVNARDAMPDGGTLEMSVAICSYGVQMTITDSGIGMDDELQERIFDPFFSSKPNGTGLGLSTVQRLVKEYGGRLSVQSVVGRGSSFTVSLPQVSAPPQNRIRTLPSETPQRTATTGVRLLLVEDDAMVRKAINQTLLSEGYDVTAVGDGDEALALLSVMDRFRCVVTDVSMRHINGDVLAKSLEVSHPKLPVILLSGNMEVTWPRETQLRTFLTKPINHAELGQAVRKALSS